MATSQNFVAGWDHAALRYVHANDGAALNTIVGIEGSFARRLGAQLAVGPDATTIGSLADGCLENELAKRCLDPSQRSPEILRYGKGSPVIDFRLPCGSGLDILVDPSPDRKAIADTVAQLDARQPAELALPCAATGLLDVRRYIPELQLMVLGTGPEARWLGHLAGAAGVRCKVIEPGPGLSLGRRPETLGADPWTAIVLLFHDHEWEGAILDWALDTPAFYVGSMGGQRVRDQRHDKLAGLGWPDHEISRIRSPVGLIPRTREPQVLGLSILAEVVKEYEGLVETPA